MLRVCAEALEAGGADVVSFLAGLSVTRSALDDIDGRVPVEVDLALWGAAPLLSGDEHFGLHAGERLNPGALTSWAIPWAPASRSARPSGVS